MLLQREKWTRQHGVCGAAYFFLLGVPDDLAHLFFRASNYMLLKTIIVLIDMQRKAIP